MKPKCPCILPDGKICGSENLDQGLNERILCHDCKQFSILVRLGFGSK